MEPTRYVIKFAFDGHAFEGYARQPGGNTVEDELITALRKARIIDDPGEARFASASRVDRGVSAIGAAVAFDTAVPHRRILSSLNASTTDLIAHSVAAVEPGYDPRRRADSRWYRYNLRQADPQAEPEAGLDVPLMREAAELFLGEHDFTSFARLDGRDPRRVVQRIGVDRRSGALVLDVWGRSFLWNQVRRMASAIRAVGAHEAPVHDVSRALETGQGRTFPPLPPEGLFLMDVIFTGPEFERSRDLPKGSIRWLRDAEYLTRCSTMYFEYLRERVPF